MSMTGAVCATCIRECERGCWPHVQAAVTPRVFLCSTPVALNPVELAVVLGQEETAMPSTEDHPLQRRDLTHKVRLRCEQPLAATTVVISMALGRLACRA